jgi:hypothetical protein
VLSPDHGAEQVTEHPARAVVEAADVGRTATVKLDVLNYRLSTTAR